MLNDLQVKRHEAGQGYNAADVLPEQYARHLCLLVLVNGHNSLQHSDHMTVWYTFQRNCTPSHKHAGHSMQADMCLSASDQAALTKQRQARQSMP